MLEVQDGGADAAALGGLRWLKPLQELDAKGDWSERRPEVRPADASGERRMTRPATASILDQ